MQGSEVVGGLEDEEAYSACSADDGLFEWAQTAADDPLDGMEDEFDDIRHGILMTSSGLCGVQAIRKSFKQAR